jgi:hypothetical protein
LRNPPADVLRDAHGPLGAAIFVAQNAPDGARVFNTFNTGPWLLWLAAPRVTHYVDPRNHLGASFVARYRELMRDPDRLARELDSLEASLALVTLADADHDQLLTYLDARSDWQGSISTATRSSTPE